MENLEINVQQSISAAFDSVNLINSLITQPIDEKIKDDVDRNVKHLEIMMGKDFFVEGLTPQQKIDIETCISSGNAYIS